MFIHLGQNTSVNKKDIIGIFDLDTATVTKTGRDFINKNEKCGNIEYADYDLPRSFVLVEEKKKYKVLLSRISSRGLKARIDDELTEEE